MKTLRKLIMASILVSMASNANDNRAVQAGTGFNFTINNTRTFTVDENTVLKKDGIVVPFANVQAGTGFKTQYHVRGNANDVSNGTIDVINLINTHKGPVTSVDPFRIFNIDVLITDNTFIDDNLQFADITAGDELKISGFIDDNSSLLASRIEADNNPLTEWKLSGYVTMLTDSQFNIGNQVVMIGGIADDNCLNGLVNGEFVEVKATPDPMFTIGSSLSSVTKIECVPVGVDTLPGDVVPAALEGFISTIVGNGNFSIGDQSIEVGANTQYINGGADDIQVNVKVEVEGLLNTTTSVMQAIKIKFREVRFKFEIPVNPADIVANESITILGQTILTTPQLRDEDGYMAGGIAGVTQIEVRGFADSSGQLFATRVRDRGNVDANDVNIDGQVTTINQPMIQVFGITIDTSASFFRDITGNSITADDFFSQISTGSLVEVDQAILDVNTGIVSGGIVQIHDVSNSLRLKSSSKAGTQGVGVGTITNLADTIYASSFD